MVARWPESVKIIISNLYNTKDEITLKEQMAQVMYKLQSNLVTLTNFFI